MKDVNIIEEFNTFWQNYKVDETRFPRRRAATLKLWINKHPLARAAMLAEVEAKGGPKGKNPYFYVQEFAEPEPTNYNGRRLQAGTRYVIAKYKGSYGTYSLDEARNFGMEIKQILAEPSPNHSRAIPEPLSRDNVFSI